VKLYEMVPSPKPRRRVYRFRIRHGARVIGVRILARDNYAAELELLKRYPNCQIIGVS
jgi:hypothetical protein